MSVYRLLHILKKHDQFPVGLHVKYTSC